MPHLSTHGTYASSITHQFLLQSGKSYTMDSLVPAVVAKDAMFGIGKQHEPVIVKLNAQQLVSAVGASRLNWAHTVYLEHWGCSGIAGRVMPMLW